MRSIKYLLELDRKQTIFGTATQINTFRGWGEENKAFIKAAPEMATKLREMVEMLPKVKDWLLFNDTVESCEECFCSDCEKKLEIIDKLDKWENS